MDPKVIQRAKRPNSKRYFERNAAQSARLSAKLAGSPSGSRSSGT